MSQCFPLFCCSWWLHLLLWQGMGGNIVWFKTLFFPVCKCSTFIWAPATDCVLFCNLSGIVISGSSSLCWIVHFGVPIHSAGNAERLDGLVQPQPIGTLGFSHKFFVRALFEQFLQMCETSNPLLARGVMSLTSYQNTQRTTAPLSQESKLILTRTCHWPFKHILIPHGLQKTPLGCVLIHTTVRTSLFYFLLRSMRFHLKPTTQPNNKFSMFQRRQQTWGWNNLFCRLFCGHFVLHMLLVHLFYDPLLLLFTVCLVMSYKLRAEGECWEIKQRFVKIPVPTWFIHSFHIMLEDFDGKNLQCSPPPVAWGRAVTAAERPAVAHYHWGLGSAWICCALRLCSVNRPFLHDGRHFYFIPKTDWSIFRSHKIQTFSFFEINHCQVQHFSLEC